MAEQRISLSKRQELSRQIAQRESKSGKSYRQAYANAMRRIRNFGTGKTQVPRRDVKKRFISSLGRKRYNELFNLRNAESPKTLPPIFYNYRREPGNDFKEFTAFTHIGFDRQETIDECDEFLDSEKEIVTRYVNEEVYDRGDAFLSQIRGIAKPPGEYTKMVKTGNNKYESQKYMLNRETFEVVVKVAVKISR